MAIIYQDVLFPGIGLKFSCSHSFNLYKAVNVGTVITSAYQWGNGKTELKRLHQGRRVNEPCGRTHTATRHSSTCALVFNQKASSMQRAVPGPELRSERAPRGRALPAGATEPRGRMLQGRRSVPSAFIPTLMVGSLSPTEWSCFPQLSLLESSNEHRKERDYFSCKSLSLDVWPWRPRRLHILQVFLTFEETVFLGRIVLYFSIRCL